MIHARDRNSRKRVGWRNNTCTLSASLFLRVTLSKRVCCYVGVLLHFPPFSVRRIRRDARSRFSRERRGGGRVIIGDLGEMSERRRSIVDPFARTSEIAGRNSTPRQRRMIGRNRISHVRRKFRTYFAAEACQRSESQRPRCTCTPVDAFSRCVWPKIRMQIRVKNIALESVSHRSTNASRLVNR